MAALHEWEDASALLVASVVSASQWLGARGGRRGRHLLADAPRLRAINWRRHRLADPSGSEGEEDEMGCDSNSEGAHAV